VRSRMVYPMLTLQREARSLAAVPRPQVVQKAEGQGQKLVLAEQEHRVVVGMSQVIGHVSIALMQTPPQLLPALSAAPVDLEALDAFLIHQICTLCAFPPSALQTCPSSFSFASMCPAEPV
jgi:hypothetical protein